MTECPRCFMEVEDEVLDGHLLWITDEFPEKGEPKLVLCEARE